MTIRRVSEKLIKTMYEEFLASVEHSNALVDRFNFHLDHFAIIDIPSKYSGIEYLKSIFELLNFEKAGNGYLPDKHNDFIWMRESDISSQIAHKTLPQVVLADFRVELLSKKAQEIIRRLTKDAASIFDFKENEALSNLAKKGDVTAATALLNNILAELRNTPWLKPSAQEYNIIKEENQLIAWCLLFGRKVNHFGFGIHLTTQFKSLEEFNHLIKSSTNFTMNTSNGEIKGGVWWQIEQSSTEGDKLIISLNGGDVVASSSFLEFVWRYAQVDNPILFRDFFPHFIPANATNVIESVFDCKAINPS